MRRLKIVNKSTGVCFSPCLPYLKRFYQEEEVDNNVKVKRGKLVTDVAVVPHEDLYWYHHGCVEQEHTAGKKHACNQRLIKHSCYPIP